MKKKLILSDMIKFQPAPKKAKDNVMEKMKVVKKKKQIRKNKSGKYIYRFDSSQ